VLIDVEDVALGHTPKLRWNETGKWVWSDNLAVSVGRPGIGLAA
jgi:hypothetical protein